MPREAGDVPLIALEGVSKSFKTLRALDEVGFDVESSEVHALLGENGSGKSTLMRIASGALPPDHGLVAVDGVAHRFRTPADAIRLGITVIGQEVPVVPDLTVTENILLGNIPCRRGVTDRRAAERRAQATLDRLDANIDQRKLVGSLSGDQRQLVAIARALTLKPRVIIFDEATSSLTEDEAGRLFDVIRGLRSEGLGVVLISHSMREIEDLADRITVLRDGKTVARGLPAGSTSRADLIGLMVGRPLVEYFPERCSPKTEEPLLEVANISAPSGAVEGVTLSVRPGEIVGLAGLVGSGRSELLRTVFGDLPRATGSVLVNGTAVAGKPSAAIAAGIAFVTDDRRGSGLVMNASIMENIGLVDLARLFPLFLNRAAARDNAENLMRKLRIKAPSSTTLVSSLSGGNQQKVVLAKWMAAAGKVWLMDEPTRGIDINAKAEIFRIMRERAEEGSAFVMSSSDLPDLLGVCNRILVLWRGRVVADLDAATATEEIITAYALGAAA